MANGLLKALSKEVNIIASRILILGGLEKLEEAGCIDLEGVQRLTKKEWETFYNTLRFGKFLPTDLTIRDTLECTLGLNQQNAITVHDLLEKYWKTERAKG